LTRIAVNLSPRVLHDLDLPQFVASLLLEFDVPASVLTLEITESAVMADPPRAMAVLGALDALGVHLSVDDYGTGYSSLTYLRQLPVHELKIDRSFVQDLAGNERDAAIVRSTIELAHQLGLSVVAEGVEDGDALERLRGWGCDAVQGFHLCRPLPGVQLAAWLRAQGAQAVVSSVPGERP
jgi:EAL domain-containing protein (putative c-di-GMP-specific phosphodiesterase class I)